MLCWQIASLFVRRVGVPAENGEHHEEADDVGHGDEPAVAEPLPDRLRLRIHVGQRHAGGGTEPDHRTAKADGVGEEAPVVAALLEGQRRERDVVEHGGHEAQAQRRLPGRRRQFFHRHQRRTGDQREQENRALEGLGQQLPVGPPQRRRHQDGHPDGERRCTGRTSSSAGEFSWRSRWWQSPRPGSPHTIATRVQSIVQAARGVLHDRRIALLLQRSRNAEDQEARRPPRHRLRGRASGLTPAIHIMVVVVSPTTLPAPPALDGGDDGGEIADMHLAPEHLARHGAADQRGGDVVEKARQHENHHQQHEPALPVVRQERRQHVRDVALLEMARQQRKADQQQEQVGQDHPFVLHAAAPGRAKPGPVFESGEEQLVDGDGRKPGQRDLQRVVMKERDAQQRQPKQDEVDRDAKQIDGLRCVDVGRGCRRGRICEQDT